jgi:hypothetical protein
MMAERREVSRVPVEEDCVVSIDGRNVSVRVENYSDIGARMRILSDRSDAVTDNDLGTEVTFQILRSLPARECTGEIIRRYYQDGVQHIAVRFWKRCRELMPQR